MQQIVLSDICDGPPWNNEHDIINYEQINIAIKYKDEWTVKNSISDVNYRRAQGRKFN